MLMHVTRPIVAVSRLLFSCWLQGWRCDETKLPSASFTFDSASHWIRPLRMWMGRATRVVGVTGKSVKHMAGVSCSQHIIQFESKKAAIFETMLAPKAIADEPFFVLQGTEGEIVVEGFGGGCTLHTLAPGTNEPLARELCRVGWDASYIGEYADFVAAITTGAPTKGPLSEALADLHVVRALISSGESNAWVDLD
jgi:predicted dehydrogenase